MMKTRIWTCTPAPKELLEENPNHYYQQAELSNDLKHFLYGALCWKFINHWGRVNTKIYYLDLTTCELFPFADQLALEEYVKLILSTNQLNFKYSSVRVDLIDTMLRLRFH